LGKRRSKITKTLTEFLKQYNYKMRKLFLISFLSAIHLIGHCQQRHITEKNITLYPNGIPDTITQHSAQKEYTDTSGYVYNVSQPELIPFFPDKRKNNGISIIICPGGGYQLIVASDEGSEVAKKFTKLGITAFVLKYRLPNDTIMKNKPLAPLKDAQMAILTIKENAHKWNLNPNKIGIVGLSAGGHLASTVGTHFDTSFIENPKNISLRPNFMVLIYPVITMDTSWGASRTRNNLLGKNPSASAIEFFSNENHVTKETPPTFIVHATDDKRITVRNSLVFYDALRHANVNVEMHLLQDGGHGFGIEHPTRKDEWVKLCYAWMKLNGF
jgi:acetyl esterase/lipase